METTSRTAAQGVSAEAGRKVDGYLLAAFPWYGLDEAFTGPRWLMQVGAAADGTVEHGATGHGEEPTDQGGAGRRTSGSRSWSRSPAAPYGAAPTAPAYWRRPRSRRPPGSPGPACSRRPGRPRWTATLRQDWLDQQTMLAWELADDLGGEAWSELMLPVDGVPTLVPLPRVRVRLGAGRLGERGPRGRAHRRLRARDERVRPGLLGDQGPGGVRGLSGSGGKGADPSGPPLPRHPGAGATAAPLRRTGRGRGLRTCCAG